MRFLLLNQFYPPDPAPTGWYLHGLARELVGRGHHVSVLCSRRSYDGKDSYPRRENLEGVEVSRLPATGFGRRGFVGKMADYGTFYFSLATALLLDRSKPDLILSLTTPPYLGVLAKLAAARHGCRRAHWVMDVYPDVMYAHGISRKNGWVYRFLSGLTRFELHGADAVLSLGPTMAERVAAYARNGKPASMVSWVPLWSDPELIPWDRSKTNSLRASRGWSAKEVVFLYSGNMGLGHRFGEFLEAAKRLGQAGPRWVFSGGGKRRGQIEDFARSNPEARIEMSDYVPQSQLRAHLCAGDVHLASLDSAWQGLMVPSKLQGSFAVGRPVLYVGGTDCETAAWILESGGGWVVEENDVGGLLEAIEQASDENERRRRGQAAYEFAQKNFVMSAACARISRLIEGVPAGKN
ncbi:MAG TPA: glycosyltransferase family 4 protein [Candidatus Baltobacteraceae bacterium]|jgi:glycosyltransferase involved in cell wall biosynthesis|nr:glycosyltransferase family 4 protein [Candidatus Baltobacteraceae bacterium]